MRRVRYTLCQTYTLSDKNLIYTDKVYIWHVSCARYTHCQTKDFSEGTGTPY